MAVNNSSNRNNGKTEYNYKSMSAKHNKSDIWDETVKLDIKDVEKAHKQIYESFSKLSKDIEKMTAATAKNTAAISLTSADRMFKQLDKMHEAYSKNYVSREAVAQNKIMSNTLNSQNKVFAELEKMHAGYLNTYIRNEAIAADKVAKLWGRTTNAIGADINVNFETSANSLETDTQLVDIFESLEESSSDMLKNMENLSEGIEDTLKRINEANKNKISNANYHSPTSDLLNSINNRVSTINTNNLSSSDKTMKLVSGLGNKLLNALVDFIDDYRRTYQGLYNSISTRSGLAGDTSKYITDMVKSFKRDNSELLKAINIEKELIPAIETVARQGLIGETAEKKAVSDVISGKLMPWFKTTNDSYINLFANLNENSINQLKGQQLLLRETQSGNRILQSELVNSLISDITPELIAIDANTGGVSNLTGDYLKIFQAMVDSGLSEQDAYSRIKNLERVQKDAYAAYTSNDASIVMTRMFYDRNGGDLIGALAQMDEITANLKESTGIYSGAVSANLGTLAEAASGWEEGEAWRQGLINGKEDELRKGSDELVEEAISKYDEVVQSAEDYVTSTEKLRNTLQNTFVEVADLFKDIPDQVVNIFKGVLTAAGGVATKNAMSSIFGTGSASAGAGSAGAGALKGATGTASSLLTNAGITFTEFMGAGGGTLISNFAPMAPAIPDAIRGWKDALTGKDANPDTAKLHDPYTEEQIAELVELQKEAEKNLAELAKTNNFYTHEELKNSPFYNRDNNYNNEDLEKLRNTLVHDYSENGYLNKDDYFGLYDAWGEKKATEYANEVIEKIFDKNTGVTHSGLKEWWQENNYVTEGEFNHELSNIVSEYIDGSHALGLPRVPYDGYIAELHEGERVLTAEEAKKYLTLSSNNYSSTSISSSSVNSDAIVSALKEVATEIIKAIKESSGPSGNNRISSMIKPAHTYDDTIVNLMSPV